MLQEKLTHPKVKPLLTNGKLIVTYREEFETVTVNDFGEIIQRERRQAEMFAENLGDGVELYSTRASAIRLAKEATKQHGG